MQDDDKVIKAEAKCSDWWLRADETRDCSGLGTAFDMTDDGVACSIAVA